MFLGLSGESGRQGEREKQPDFSPSCPLAHDWQVLHPGLMVTASFGLVQAGADCSTDALLALADAKLYGAKLYEAKRNGRNRVQI